MNSNPLEYDSFAVTNRPPDNFPHWLTLFLLFELLVFLLGADVVVVNAGDNVVVVALDGMKVGVGLGEIRPTLFGSPIGVSHRVAFDLETKINFSNVSFTSDFAIYLRSDMSLSAIVMINCRPMLRANYEVIHPAYDDRKKLSTKVRANGVAYSRLLLFEIGR